MNINKILIELKERRRALEEAIAALELLKKHQAPRRALTQARTKHNAGKRKLRSFQTRTIRAEAHAKGNREKLIVFPTEPRLANSGWNLHQKNGSVTAPRT